MRKKMKVMEEEKRLVDEEDSSSEEEENRIKKLWPLEDSSSEEEVSGRRSKKVCRGSCHKTFLTNANLIKHYRSKDPRVTCIRPLNVEELIDKIRQK